MVLLIQMDHPELAWLHSFDIELAMPFSEAIKYWILGISIILLLLSLVILAWQAYRCYLTRSTTSTEQVEVKSDHLGSSTPSTKVDGSLRFSLYYDQLHCRLVVTVLGLEGQWAQSQNQSLQPFVKLILIWAGSLDCIDKEGEGTPPVLCTVLQEWRTRIVKGSCNPWFGDQFSCTLQDNKQLHHIKLRMEVMDFDRYSRHAVLGAVRVPLGQLNTSYPLELLRDLQTPRKDLVGEVLLSLKFLPTSQRLEVGLLKVRTLLATTCSSAAIYARIGVQYNQCKLNYQKTSEVEHVMVTVFNEVLIFPLPQTPLEQCKICVSLYEIQKSFKSSKQLLGHLTVRKEENLEDKHWGQMMSSIRQPIAKWHSLLI